MSSASAHAWPAHCRDAKAPTLCRIHRTRSHVNELRARMSLAPLGYQWLAEGHPAHRARILRWWRSVLAETRARYHARLASPYAAASAWAHQPGPSCISSHEGGLTSVNPAGPYYGKWQADRSFEAAYNQRALARWGDANHWPQREQDLMAYRGWQHRGYSPWPSTSAMCGL